MLAHQLDRLAQKRPLVARLHAEQPAARAARGHRLLPGLPLLHRRRQGVREPDRKFVERAVRRATARNPTLSTVDLPTSSATCCCCSTPSRPAEEDRAEQRRFVGKFQQVTAPVMAKGVEDTAFYVYNRLVSLNEVGGDPARFGVAAGGGPSLHPEPPGEVAPALCRRSSTHDTKRSEDVRARLNVLSEMPQRVAGVPGALESS